MKFTITQMLVHKDGSHHKVELIAHAEHHCEAVAESAEMGEHADLPPFEDTDTFVVYATPTDTTLNADTDVLVDLRENPDQWFVSTPTGTRPLTPAEREEAIKHKAERTAAQAAEIADLQLKQRERTEKQEKKPNA